MRNIIKKIFACFTAITILCFCTASASEWTLDLENYTLTVYEKCDKTYSESSYSMIVLNPGFTHQSMGSRGAIQNQFEGKINDEGEIVVTFPVNTELFPVNSETLLKEGKMNLRIKSPVSIENTEIYCASPNAVLEAITALEDNRDNSVTEFSNILTQYADVLAINTEAFKKIDKTELAKKVAAATFEFTIGNANELQTLIRQITVLEAFRQNKADVLFDGDEIHYNLDTKLSNIDETCNITALKIYRDDLNSTGIENVQKYICGKEFKSMSDFYEAFTQGVIIEGIRNNKILGYGHIGEILEKNASFAKMKLGSYESNEDLDRKILQGKCSTIKEIEDIISEHYGEGTGGSGDLGESGESGNSGSSGSKGNAGSASIEVAPDTDNQNTTDAKSEIELLPAIIEFSDLDGYEWAHESISELLKKGVISKAEDRKFRPGDNISREEFAKLIAVAFNITQQPAEKKFLDITDTDWSSEYIYALANAGIVNGKSETEFGKRDSLSRQDMAVIIYRVLDNLGKIEDAATNSIFNDSNEFADYATKEINYLANIGIVNGLGNGVFGPKLLCTRAQCATIINRILKQYYN